MKDAPDSVKVEAKPWWKSRTIRLNVAGAIVAVAIALQGAALPLPPWALAALAGIVTVGNIVLRLVTTQPVTLSATPQVGEAPAPPWTPTVTGPPRGL